MDTKDRRIPFVHELMRRVRESTLSRSVLLFPVRSTHIPIGEPHLFRFQILHFHIKDTIVGDKRLETFIMMTCQPIYGESTEAGAYTTQAILIYIRFLGYLVNSSEIVFHALSAIIAADSLIPFQAKSGKTPTVRCHDNIVISRHDLEIPAVRPELAHRALRATLTEQQGRILLIRIELRRIDNPR